MCLIEFLGHYSGMLTALATLIGAGVAVYGVREWKRQFKWRIEYETARRYIRALYNLRDAINRDVRNPAVSYAEIKTAEDTAKINGQDVERSETYWVVYNRRWEKITEARTKLREELLETEVLWGKEIWNAQTELDSLIGTLYGKIWANFHNVPTTDADEYLYHTDGTDSFSIKLDAIIEKIQEPLRSRLR